MRAVPWQGKGFGEAAQVLASLSPRRPAARDEEASVHVPYVLDNQSMVKDRERG